MSNNLDSNSVTLQMPIYAALAYDAVKLLAKGMTEVYREGGEVPFGSQVIQKMIGQQYTSKEVIFCNLERDAMFVC